MSKSSDIFVKTSMLTKYDIKKSLC